MSSDFEDRIEELKGKVSQLKNSLQTEKETKNAPVMPFIIGYDAFNQLEVYPICG